MLLCSFVAVKIKKIRKLIASKSEINRENKRNKEIIKNETEEAVETASEDNGSAIEEKAKSSLCAQMTADVTCVR